MCQVGYLELFQEYENKSLEELRCEDYIAGRKGTAGGIAQPSGGLFGAPQPAGGGLFGSSTTSSAGKHIPTNAD